ncbi:class I SAM-dependent methyltransferase family protein [Natronorubrum sp. JWXQ-INN-674]|uniref:tRNA(Phe) (4-demethylwyosine(37)-C(7)) aminocarboxypropyltransferase n=1 Tax=Natronorubrum halalkaliphilum TaxID=2691917 RepID=A0A6B0VMU5_9EURY|nr:class I SAM-dependent methyltransferase family protein [Natronorubrum halalkaliphilum]MXV62900.1 class I SAM-dependent methyltransferase family protein [Natronorubrum halalkaliphilum]
MSEDENPAGSPLPDTPAEDVDDALEQAGAAPDAPLAAVVEKPRAETAIESLRAEGVYDDSRRVRETRVQSEAKPWGGASDSKTREQTETDATPAGGPERLALPVLEPPTETRVLEVVRQLDPEPRNPDLEALLADRGWSDEALESVPGSWAVVGSVILVTVPTDCPDETALAEALLELHGEADSVLADEGIANDGDAGTYREPRTRLLAGQRDTETIHTEHGTQYGLDPARVMFSPGNQAERARMGELGDSDERVFDMFAGIGYFTLPMARAGAQVTATEINPTAFRYLLENVMLNDVGDRVDAYMTDCRELASEVDADRVVMGYYGSADEADSAGDEGGPEGDGNGNTNEHGTRTDEAHDFLADALEALVPGGVVHYHEATPEPRLWERPLERLEAAGDAADRELEVLEKRRVKSHSAGVEHVVIDARFE